MATSIKKRNIVIFGIFALLSLLLVGSLKTDPPKDLLAASTYQKIYSFNTDVSLSKDISPETIEGFYNLAVDEYRKANFGFSKDLFEAITQKSNSHPMSWYYLAEIHKNIYPYSSDGFKKKICLENITRSPLSNDLKISAYDDLSRLSSRNPEESIDYGRKAVALEDNLLSRYILLTAYYNAYKSTSDQKYKKALVKMYDPKIRSLFGEGKFVPWVEELVASK